jgi:cobalt/nickel transport system ATP-binding protein
MTSILTFDRIRYAYPNCPDSLHEITFSLEEGAKVAVVGPNGAGKTTLLLMCNGILQPTEGRVLLRGTPLRYDAKSLREIRRRVGFVFQNSDTQLFAPTVYQDVAFGPVNLGMSPEEVKGNVTEALQEVGLSGYGKRLPHQLSSGEKKRAAIAGTLAMKPEVLVFDEPTSSLDPAGASDLMELLDELNAQGTTVIISTHDVELAYHWADMIILMNRGTVLRVGSPEEIFTDPSLISTSNLRMPSLVEVYMELRHRQLVSETSAPKSVLQLISALAGSIGNRGIDRPYGTITVCEVEGVDSDHLRSWIAGHPSLRLGAMGTRAKSLAGQTSIPLDFTYGVIDKCILRALIGESSLILTTGAMVSRVQRRVREYNTEAGISIPLAVWEERQDQALNRSLLSNHTL